VNGLLEMTVRDATCTKCKMHAGAETVCQVGSGPDKPRIIAVTKYPSMVKVIATMMAEAGIDLSTVMWCAAIKCMSWTSEPGKKDIKACRPFLLEEIDATRPAYVITFGNEALEAVTKRSGISKYRGKHFEVTTEAGHRAIVFPTISPSAIKRNPGLEGGFLAELRYFARLLEGGGDPFELPENRIHIVETKPALTEMLAAIRSADAVAFDIEGTGLNEFAPDAKIISISVTCATGTELKDAQVYELPLYHPGSVWKSQWRQVLTLVAKALLEPRAVIAHNGKFDGKWIKRFTKITVKTTFDTIMAISLINENSVKALKPLCQQILGVPPWGIDTHDLLNTPLDEVLAYNGLDTWYDLILYYKLRGELKKRPKQTRLFRRLSMPLMTELVEIEHVGVWVDTDRLKQNMALAQEKADAVRVQLDALVPPRDEWPEHVKDVNWNVSDFLRWFLFDHLGLPVLAWGKLRENGQRLPSADRTTLATLAEKSEECRLLLEYRKYTKFVTSFFQPYLELLDPDGRLHTTYKPWVPVTGRLSSGKEDAEQTVTRASQHKGVNLQQVPKDGLVRSIFGAQPGWVWIEADYSQVEMRVAAYLSRDPVLIQAYNTGQDVHTLTATRVTGKPASQITKAERNGAKPVNFGYLFGMSWRTFIIQAFRDYGIVFSEAAAQGSRRAFFDLYRSLVTWHAKQRKLVNKYARVENPLGRIRHLPDIRSPEQEVRHSAERQAINAPVQSFASDLTALSVIFIARRFRALGLRARIVGTVHDSILIEAPEDEKATAARVVKRVMENIPLEKLFDVVLDVPLVADVTIGTHWGETA
jgi:uracil-DNA glycosylase family 4